MTYVKINGAWYKELQFKEEYTSQEKLYLWYIDLIHKKNLMIRLANNIDLLERMLSKLPKMEDELRTHKTLYVNKVGGFFMKTDNDEKDAWERHKSYGNCTQDEKEFYADELDEAIHWDALAAAYDDF